MPKLPGEMSVYAREQGYTEQYAYVASGDGAGQIEYQGWAAPGTATSAGGWRIRKLTYDSSSRMSKIEWAGGRDDFSADNAWNNRASLSYS